MKNLTKIKKSGHSKIVFMGVFTAVLSMLFIACNKKNEFLNAKPTSSLLIPNTLQDFQELLDAPGSDNGVNEVPGLGETSADDYYLSQSIYNSRLFPWQQNAYIWANDIYGGSGGISDWDIPYHQVLTANTVLEGLNKIQPSDSSSVLQWNSIKGSALFLRSFAFFNLAQVYAPVYDNATANTDIGVPLRLVSDISIKVNRSSVQATYDQIINDLKASVSLLPVNINYNYRNRASQPVALAMLARVYLSMRQYQNAFNYANQSLNLYNTLVDYNSLSTTAPNPFSMYFPESIYFANFTSNSITLNINFSQGFSVDTALYKSYSINDLRRALYFTVNGTFINLKGKYTGSYQPFTGLATDEMYLIRAECYARNNDMTDALNDLNSLLTKRYKTGTFTPITAISASDALNKILVERRKELVMRGLRWIDIRRLNKDGANITLTRNINSQTYTLPANDPRYTLPIPPDAITLGGYVQNQR